MAEPQPDSTRHDSALGKILIDEATLQARVKELGQQITEDYQGRVPLLVGVLKGAFMFMSDLSRAIDLPVDVDFMAVSSYGSATRTSGVVRIVKDLDMDLAGRHVLVVEDIVDSGVTLTYLMNLLQQRRPKSLNIATLLDKPERRLRPVDVAYVGFKIPDEFVVGYGLDFAEDYRNLRDICILSEQSS